jgi:hypothetical protein
MRAGIVWVALAAAACAKDEPLASCDFPHNSSKVPAVRCPTNDPCPDCAPGAIADGVYFQIQGMASYGVSCGMCLPTGTLRIDGGVMDFVSHENVDICTSSAIDVRMYGSFSISGELVDLMDNCGRGEVFMRFGVSADGGVLELIETGWDAGLALHQWDYAYTFQRQ